MFTGGSAGSFKETGSGGGFSLGSDDVGRSLTPMIPENDNLNVDNNHLINISVNQNVLNSSFIHACLSIHKLSI